MTDQQPQNPGHEEAIVPVKPGLKGARSNNFGDDPKRTGVISLPGVLLAVLIAIAGVVFFVLPNWVEEQEEQVPVVERTQPDTPVVLEGPFFTPEELEGLRDQAESLLALLLSQQGELDGQSASEWGGEDFGLYQALSREGDDAYLIDAFYDAVPAYSQALELGEELLERSVELIAAALSAGGEALEAGNSAVALEQFELVLRIEAGNSLAQTGLLRARQLPEVFELMRVAEEFERAGSLEEAAEVYRDALAIDSLWVPAQSALVAVNTVIQNRRFDTLMSQGLSNLAQEDYDDAYEVFTRALVLRPNSRNALDGQTQAEQGQKLDQIMLVEARALAFELRELWELAIGQYRNALETDSSLAFAQQGLQRAQSRADLDLKLINILENPDLLFNDRVLRDTESLLTDAHGISEAGPRLGEQVIELSRLVRLASTPIRVEIHSDEQTEVTVYRVGQLGKFRVRNLELRPGSYTVVGSRDGFVDVRQTLNVVPGRESSPIMVECVESI